MAIRWICTKCKGEAGDGFPEGTKFPEGVEPINYGGICPLCGGKLKAVKAKKK